MKKFLALILCALMLVSLASCNKKADNNEDNTDKTNTVNTTDTENNSNTVPDNGAQITDLEFISQEVKNTWKPKLVSLLSKTEIKDCDGSGSFGVGLMDLNFDNTPEVLVAYAGGSAGNVFIEIYDMNSSQEITTYNAAHYLSDSDIYLCLAKRGEEYVTLTEGSIRFYKDNEGWTKVFGKINSEFGHETLLAESIDASKYYAPNEVEKGRYDELYQAFLNEYKKIEATQIQLVKWSSLEANSKEEYVGKMADALIKSSQRFVDIAPDNVTTPVTSPITEEQALKIASRCWGVETGDIDINTGFRFRIRPYFNDVDTEKYHKVFLEWLVEGSHYSVVDELWFDKESGEPIIPHDENTKFETEASNKRYKILQNGVSFKQYYIYDNDGGLAVYGYTTKPLGISMLSESIVDISIGMGTETAQHQYYDTEGDRLSEKFSYVATASENLVAYLDENEDLADRNLVVRDIFDEDGFYNEFGLDFSPAVLFPIESAEFLEGESKLHVTYLSETPATPLEFTFNLNSLANLPEISFAYSNVLTTDEEISNSAWAQYFLYDMDGNGSEELIVRFGQCEADMKMRVYSYQNGRAELMGETYASHCGIYGHANDVGVILHQGHQMMEMITHVKISETGLVSTVISEYQRVDEYTDLEYAVELEEFSPENLDPLFPEREAAKRSLEAALENKITVYETDSKEYIYLKDCKTPYNRIPLSEVGDLSHVYMDFDGDGVDELVIGCGDTLILRYYRGTVYVYPFTFREISYLYTDGTCSWNDTGENFEYGSRKLSFKGAKLFSKDIVRIVNNSEYYLNGKQTTEEEITKYNEDNPKTQVEFLPLAVLWNGISRTDAEAIAEDYWGIEDGHASGSCGTLLVYRIDFSETIKIDEKSYYVVYLRADVYHSGTYVPYDSYIEESVLVDFITGECTPYVENDAKG